MNTFTKFFYKRYICGMRHNASSQKEEKRNVTKGEKGMRHG